MLAEAHDRAPAAERHPERRMKSAYAAFEERELPVLKEENPGLRLSQLKNMLQKMVCAASLDFGTLCGLSAVLWMLRVLAVEEVAREPHEPRPCCVQCSARGRRR